MTGPEESAHVFSCRGEQLIGILHRPESAGRKGVVVLVGGPQYRVGSHRQFVLLARHLAMRGIPVFRFDYRGMGDSSGLPVAFLDSGPDLRRAIDVFETQVPSVSEFVIWGLCDAATAAAIYAPDDERVTGLVLLNPWARSEKSQAVTHLRHYYLKRLLAVDFWRQLFTGKGSLIKSLASLLADLKRATVSDKGAAEVPEASNRHEDFRMNMQQGLQRFKGRTLFLISELDLTAREFMDMTNASAEWQSLLDRDAITLTHIADADHTCSSREKRGEVERLTERWLSSW